MLFAILKAVCIINGFYSNSNKEATVLSAHYITQPEHINQICSSQFVWWKEISEKQTKNSPPAVTFRAHSVFVAALSS